MTGPFVKSRVFKTAVAQVFKKLDKDKSGDIDRDELVSLRFSTAMASKTCVPLAAWEGASHPH